MTKVPIAADVDADDSGLDRTEVDSAARREYARRAVAPLKLGRSQRLAELRRTASGFEVAAGLFRDLLDLDGTRPHERLYVRLPYFYSERDRAEAQVWSTPDGARSPSLASKYPGLLGKAVRKEVESRPPSTRLLNRTTSAGALYLMAIGLGQILSDPGAKPNFRSRRKPVNNYHGTLTWTRLLGDDRAAEQVRRSFTAALKRLDAAGLVEPGRGNPWVNWTLQHENGCEPYRVPTSSEQLPGLGIDVRFWTNGWINVLKPTEVAVYLMLRHLRKTVPRDASGGVGAADWIRRAHYGVTPETYLAAHELEEFGLIRRKPSIHDRRIGRISKEDAEAVQDGTLELTVDHFTFIKDGFARPAWDVVSKALSRSAVPPRFQPELLSPFGAL